MISMRHAVRLGVMPDVCSMFFVVVSLERSCYFANFLFGMILLGEKDASDNS